MREQLVHRGPDGGDTWVSPDGRVGLGFRRLAIIDLSPDAMQPIANEDGTCSSSSTARSTTTREIRAELEAIGGHVWRTDHSDTEMIVHAFEQWGIDCIHRFRGMFALAIWDARSDELWLVRDRIGIKPLYYSHPPRPARLRVARSRRCCRIPSRSAAVDESRVLPLPLVPDDARRRRRCSRASRSSPGGTWLRVARRRRRPRSTATGTCGTTSTPLDGVVRRRDRRARARRAAHVGRSYRKVSDVPVGVFLSGGIDSSTNAALFSEGETHAGQDVLDRLRGRVRRRTATSSTTRG